MSSDRSAEIRDLIVAGVHADGPFVVRGIDVRYASDGTYTVVALIRERADR